MPSRSFSHSPTTSGLRGDGVGQDHSRAHGGECRGTHSFFMAGRSFADIKAEESRI